MSGTYEYEDVGIDLSDRKSIIFRVRTTNDANIALVEHRHSYAPEEMYEIVIGGTSNTQSTIR